MDEVLCKHSLWGFGNCVTDFTWFLTGFLLPDPHISDREVLTSSTAENSTTSPYKPHGLTVLLGTYTK